MHRHTGWTVGQLVVIFVIAPATSQASVEPSPDVLVLAQQMPECREFRNDCVVCVRSADGKLGCSNVGIACTPSRQWRCSLPKKTEERTK